MATAQQVRADDPTGGYFDGTEIRCPGIPQAEATVTQCYRMAYQSAIRCNVNHGIQSVNNVTN